MGTPGSLRARLSAALAIRAIRMHLETQMAPKTAKPVKRPADPKPAAVSPEPAPSTKKQKLIALLRQKNGHNLSALGAALGWLPHTVRAALTGLRKAGFLVERTREGHRATRYRITEYRSR